MLYFVLGVPLVSINKLNKALQAVGLRASAICPLVPWEASLNRQATFDVLDAARLQGASGEVDKIGMRIFFFFFLNFTILY